MDVQVDLFHAHLEGRRQCGLSSNGRCHDVISIVVCGGSPDPEAKAHPRRSRLLTLWLLSRRSSMLARPSEVRGEAEVPRVVLASFRRRLIPALRLGPRLLTTRPQTTRYKGTLAILLHT
jgi:hypothetical protein